MKRARAVAVVALALGGVAACQVLLGVEDRSHPGPAADAGVAAAESGADAPVAEAGACRSRQPAAPSTAPDLGTPRDIVFALTSITLSDPQLGFDLDKQCTCSPGAPKPSCISKATQCDVDGGEGVDNSLASFLVDPSLTATLGNSGPAQFNARLKAGEAGLLLRLSEYNGDTNDPQVLFVAYGSNGTEYADAGADAQVPTVPASDGTDRWTIDPGGIEGSPDSSAPWDAPRYFTRNAYVVDGSFVVSRLQMRLGLGDLIFDVSNAVLSGQIRRNPDGVYFIDKGVLAGRILASTFLRSLGVIQPGGGPPLCPSHPLFGGAATIVCAARDVVSDPSRDGFDNACDAVSFGVGFTAVQASITSVRERPRVVNDCDASASAYECPP